MWVESLIYGVCKVVAENVETPLASPSHCFSSPASSTPPLLGPRKLRLLSRGDVGGPVLMGGKEPQTLSVHPKSRTSPPAPLTTLPHTPAWSIPCPFNLRASNALRRGFGALTDVQSQPRGRQMPRGGALRLSAM